MIISLMRVRCILGCLLFVQSVTPHQTLKPEDCGLSVGAKETSTLLNLKYSCAIEDKIKNKKQECRKPRSIRDAKYFESSCLNFLDEDPLKNSDDVNENRSGFVEILPPDTDKNMKTDDTSNRRSQNGSNLKGDLAPIEIDHEKALNESVRKGRQISYDENYKNDSSLSRWVKPTVDHHSEAAGQINTVQKNKAFPVNDDVADFALYMLKNKNRKAQSGLAWGEQCSNLIDETSLDEESHNGISGRFGGNLFGRNDHGVLGCSGITKNDVLFEDDAALTFSNPEMLYSDRREKSEISPGSQIANFIKSISPVECDDDAYQPEGVEKRSQTSGVVNDVVREKIINLPEPLVFNTSHVVSSFVYTMIPFRSPLLNLLESDKHSKYIMIKIDPVLQPAKRVFDINSPMGNHEAALEKNIMTYIDKLIGSDHIDQSIEGMSRSMKSDSGVGLRTNNNRMFRNANKQTTDSRRFLLDHKCRSCIGAVS